LHDCGKFISISAHYRNSYHIIRGLDIVGLNTRDLEIVACVALYHSRIIPSAQDGIYTALNENDRVIVSKLTAILRIADALDRSQTQKFDTIEVKLDEEKLMISIVTDHNIDLEQWAFIEKSKFFEEVFGFKTKLKKKKVSQ
jgi:exopolyphosphatase/guanosine-5'-triphosphate,3'-diphosphate pyrophosphatase